MRINPRHFRPWFLIRQGLHLVAIDEVQPVAVIFDRFGALVRTVDWTWSAPPRWNTVPPRWVCSREQSIWVDDGAESDVVRLDVDNAGQVSTSRTETFPKNQAERLHPYMLWRGHLRARADSGSWHTRSVLGDGGVSWYSSVEWQRTDAELAETECDLGYGSVHAATAIGEALFVAVRRTGKRPWVFRPPVDLLRLTRKRGAETICARDGLDIADRCREISPWAPSPESVAREWLNTHLRWTDPGEWGESEYSLTVRDCHADPVAEFGFRHPSRPGLWLVRRQQLRTEFGFSQGLGDWGVLWAEDLNGSFFPPAEWAENSVLHV